MSELVWASQVLRNQIAPPREGATKGSRIRDAATALRWKISRAKDVWYEDERVSIKPRELRRVEEVSGLKYGRQEADELDALIAKADRLLHSTDPNFSSAFVDAVREVARIAYRAGTQKRE